jgi:hypothetical protein
MPPIIAILIRSSALLDNTLLLIRLLTLLTPLWRLIFAVLLLLVTFLLRLVHTLRVVLSRAVHCHKLQWLSLGGVDELVLSSCWHYNDV